MTAEWQPIATAPRDGDDFLAHSIVEGWYGLAYWLPRGDLRCRDSVGDLFEPTHWMPLPEPPK